MDYYYNKQENKMEDHTLATVGNLCNGWLPAQLSTIQMLENLQDFITTLACAAFTFYSC